MVSFLKIQNNYNSLFHPDVMSKDKTEYEVKTEFIECFHKFAIYYQNSRTKINKDTFMRFFEMYC